MPPATIFDGRSVLITGGTGFFGARFVEMLVETTDAARVIVFSRDEFKQVKMAQRFRGNDRLRFFLGDVRDLPRLRRAFDGVDIVVHAAALKQIPVAEYNPFEFVKTNILGAHNVIEAAIDREVCRVVALSTDKASSPINLYGATKLVSDKLFVAGNAYAGAKDVRFSVVRYGNVVGSRGSVVPTLRALAPGEVFHLTDERMTRFWITVEQGIELVRHTLTDMRGGEIFVPKIPSMRLVDLVRWLAPDASIEVIGARAGEKLHEEMISPDEGRRAIDRGDHYVLQPEIRWAHQNDVIGDPMPDGFRYGSETNDQWLDRDSLLGLLDG